MVLLILTLCHTFLEKISTFSSSNHHEKMTFDLLTVKKKANMTLYSLCPVILYSTPNQSQQMVLVLPEVYSC